MSFQQQTTAINGSSNGLIAIDEHSSASCMIHDVTLTGLNLTLLDGTEVPATFILTIGSDVRVCRVVRRHDEQIEASFADLGAVATPVRAARLGFTQERRRFGQAQSFRHAA